jgi:hypothetical protein
VLTAATAHAAARQVVRGRGRGDVAVAVAFAVAFNIDHFSAHPADAPRAEVNLQPLVNAALFVLRFIGIGACV